jgi:hypothetical protein
MGKRRDGGAAEIVREWKQRKEDVAAAQRELRERRAALREVEERLEELPVGLEGGEGRG